MVGFEKNDFHLGDIMSLQQIKEMTALNHKEARQMGGYVVPDPRWYDMARGLIEGPRNCFYKNLDLIRSRNNSFDRLCIASLSRPAGPIHHCFIMNGDWIIDHSNLMRKKIDRDDYFSSNVPVDFKFINVTPSLHGHIIAFMAQSLKMTGERKIPKQHGSLDEALNNHFP